MLLEAKQKKIFLVNEELDQREQNLEQMSTNLMMIEDGRTEQTEGHAECREIHDVDIDDFSQPLILREECVITDNDSRLPVVKTFGGPSAIPVRFGNQFDAGKGA